jgi:hypothetical protein
VKQQVTIAVHFVAPFLLVRLRPLISVLPSGSAMLQRLAADTPALGEIEGERFSVSA